MAQALLQPIRIAVATAVITLLCACDRSGPGDPLAGPEESVPGEAQRPGGPSTPTGAAVVPPTVEIVPEDRSHVAPSKGRPPPPESELSYKVLFEMLLARNHADLDANVAAVRYAQHTAPMPTGNECGAIETRLIANEVEARRELDRIRAYYEADREAILAAEPRRRFRIRYRLPGMLGQYDERAQAFPLALSPSRQGGIQLNVGVDGITQGGSGQRIVHGVAAKPDVAQCNRYYNLLDGVARNRVADNRSDGKRFEEAYYWTVPDMFSFEPNIPSEASRALDTVDTEASQDATLSGASRFPKSVPMSEAEAGGFIERNPERVLLLDVVYDVEALRLRPADWGRAQVTPDEAFDIRIVSLAVIDPTDEKTLLSWENDPAPPPLLADVPERLQPLYRRVGARAWNGRLVGGPPDYDKSGVTDGAALRVLELAALKAHPDLKDDERRDRLFGKHLPFHRQAEGVGNATEVPEDDLDRLMASAPALPIPMVSISKVGLGRYDEKKEGYAFQGRISSLLPTLNVASGELIAPTVMAFDVPDFLPLAPSERKAFEQRLLKVGGTHPLYEVVRFDLIGFDEGAEGKGQEEWDRVLGLRIKPLSVEFYADAALTRKVLEYRPVLSDLTALADKAPLVREGAGLPVANPGTFNLLLLKHAGAEHFDGDAYRSWLRLRQQMELALWQAGPWQWTLRDPWANFSPASLLTHGEFPTTDTVEAFKHWSLRRAERLGDRIRFVLRPQMITARHAQSGKDGVRMKEILGWDRSERGKLGFDFASSSGRSWQALDERFGEDGYYAVPLGTIDTDPGNRRTAALLFEVPEEKLVKLPMQESAGASVASIDFVTAVTGFEQVEVSKRSSTETLLLIKLRPESLVWRDAVGRVLKTMPANFE